MTTPQNDHDWISVFVGQDMGDLFIQTTFRVLAKATPEQRRQKLDALARADEIALRARDWAKQTIQLAKLIDDGEATNVWHIRELFWIRLSGTLFELAAYWERIAAAPDAPKAHPVRLAARRAVDAITLIHGTLSEAELIFVHWLRDRAAHMRPDSYEMKWQKGKVKEHRSIKGVARIQTVIDIDRHRRDLLRAHGSDAAFAAALVTRLKPHLLSLYRATHEMHPAPSTGRASRAR
jgi:hypothetical protein